MIDYTKPVQTVSGEPVEIITTQGRGNYPVVGYRGSEESERHWNLCGEYCVSSLQKFNLINAPEKPKTIVRWFNVYKDSIGAGYESQETANHYAEKTRIACKRVEFTEGEFDD